jgi:predicted acylesterase/phospholipase RssA
MARNALVVSGGSSKGAFAVGVAERLREKLNVEFDLVAGTSTGALMAPLVVTGELTVLEELYSTMSASNVLMLRQPLDIVRTGSVLDASGLRQVIEDVYTDARAQTILTSAKQMFITTVSLESGRVTYFHTGPNPQKDPYCDYVPITDRAALIEAVMASAMQPVLMLPVTIDHATHVDGGVRRTVPIKVTIDNGATDVYAVVLTAENETADQGPMTDLVTILKRTIDLFGQEIVLSEIRQAQLYTDSVNYLAAVENGLKAALPDAVATIDNALQATQARNPFATAKVVNLHLIRPEDKLLPDSLQFSTADMRRMVRLGRDRVDTLWGNS